jgi:hypothetical protein
MVVLGSMWTCLDTDWCTIGISSQSFGGYSTMLTRLEECCVTCNEGRWC